MGEECKRGELEIQPMSQEIARRLCRAKKRSEYSDPAKVLWHSADARKGNNANITTTSGRAKHERSVVFAKCHLRFPYQEP